MTLGPFSVGNLKDLGLFSFTGKLRRHKVQIIVTPDNSCSRVRLQAPVAQRVDNATQRINHYPVDNCWQNKLHYPPHSDISGG